MLYNQSKQNKFTYQLLTATGVKWGSSDRFGHFGRNDLFASWWNPKMCMLQNEFSGGI